jgi:hypothetical protein
MKACVMDGPGAEVGSQKIAARKVVVGKLAHQFILGIEAVCEKHWDPNVGAYEAARDTLPPARIIPTA